MLMGCQIRIICAGRPVLNSAKDPCRLHIQHTQNPTTGSFLNGAAWQLQADNHGQVVGYAKDHANYKYETASNTTKNPATKAL